MLYNCYILYSASLDRYYIGYTSNINERLKLHNSSHFGVKSYTSRSADWEIFLEIPCETIEQAVFIEAWIKKMKSRKYLKNLKKYPELVEKIKSTFIK
jgi:putative endonuclease